MVEPNYLLPKFLHSLPAPCLPELLCKLPGVTATSGAHLSSRQSRCCSSPCALPHTTARCSAKLSRMALSACHASCCIPCWHSCQHTAPCMPTAALGASFGSRNVFRILFQTGVAVAWLISHLLSKLPALLQLFKAVQTLHLHIRAKFQHHSCANWGNLYKLRKFSGGM